jgi:hypothetical protein
MTVMASVNNDDGSHCVDIFRRPNGTYGFEEFRRDVEDPSGWFAVGGFARRVFKTEADARAEARKLVVWFDG